MKMESKGDESDAEKLTVIPISTTIVLLVMF